MNGYGVVVVINKYGEILDKYNNTRLRGIYDLKVPYNNKEFKKYFYSVNPKLPGDRFKHCATPKRFRLLMNRVNNPSYILK